MVSSRVFEFQSVPINVKQIIDSTVLMDIMADLLRLWLAYNHGDRRQQRQKAAGS